MGRRGATLALPRTYALNSAGATSPRLAATLPRCYLLLILYGPARCRTSATACSRSELGKRHHALGRRVGRLSEASIVAPLLDRYAVLDCLLRAGLCYEFGCMS